MSNTVDGMIIKSHIGSNGRKYQYIKYNGKFIRLHIYLAENYIIFRKLNKNEIIHHIDCNPLNNNLDNLQVMSRSEHIKIHKPNLGYKFTDEQRKHLSDAHLGYKVKEETKEKLSKAMSGRIITWGDKISQSKTKIYKEDIIKIILDNPNITIKELKYKLNIKSSMSIYKYGGLKRLKKEVIIA